MFMGAGPSEWNLHGRGDWNKMRAKRGKVRIQRLVQGKLSWERHLGRVKRPIFETRHWKKQRIEINGSFPRKFWKDVFNSTRALHFEFPQKVIAFLKDWCVCVAFLNTNEFKFSFPWHFHSQSFLLQSQQTSINRWGDSIPSPLLSTGQWGTGGKHEDRGEAFHKLLRNSKYSKPDSSKKLFHNRLFESHT